MKRTLLPLSVALCLLTAATCQHLPQDQSAIASEANDPTVQFSGFGAVSKKGYLFIQVNEKAAVTGPIGLVVPKLNCDRDSCVRFQFFRKDGSSSDLAGGIPKNQTSVSFQLGDLVGHTGDVLMTDDGEYSCAMQFFYKGEDGIEHTMILSGFIRVNVVSAAYRAVECNSPSRAWKVKLNENCEAQFTTSGRSVACGEGCE